MVKLAVGLLVFMTGTASEVTPVGCSCTRISPEYDVRRHSMSTSRSNGRAARTPVTGAAGGGASSATTDSSRWGPPSSWRKPRTFVA